MIANPQEVRTPLDPSTSPSNIRLMAKSFERSLRAARKSPRTVATYLEALSQLADHLERAGMPTSVDQIRREHVEDFLVELDSRVKPATVSNRYRALTTFFRWCCDEGEIARSPMEKMKPPSVPVVPPEVLTEDQLRRLLKTCDGTDFDARRDVAILRLFIDTGMRRSELTNLRISDLDQDLGVAIVVGKGDRPRGAPYGDRTSVALDRYLRARSRHPMARRTNALWIGQRSAMTTSGITQVVRRRGREAGVSGLHPHVFRHTMAHRWLADGGQETDLMRLAGWRSRDMISRYGASAADERARQAHALRGLGDRL